jgi:hypothetical protein
MQRADCNTYCPQCGQESRSAMIPCGNCGYNGADTIIGFCTHCYTIGLNDQACGCNKPDHYPGFLGWGFGELFQAYGLDYLPGEYNDDDTQIKAIQEYMDWLLEINMFKVDNPEVEEAALLLKQFLAALARDGASGYWKPVYEGLAAVEENNTLFQAVHPLVGHLWT